MLFRCNSEITLYRYRFSQDGKPIFAGEDIPVLVRKTTRQSPDDPAKSQDQVEFVLPRGYTPPSLDDKIRHNGHLYQLKSVTPHYDPLGVLRATSCVTLP